MDMIPALDDRETSTLTALLAQRELELQELNHRIANSLQMVCSYLSLEKRRLEDPRLAEVLDTASARLAAVAKVHRHLAVRAVGSRVDLKSLLEDLCPEVADTVNLTCSLSVDPMSVSGDLARAVATVINELAINAAKHAYGNEEGGKLRIECRDMGDHLRLVVADAGKGLGKDFAPTGGNGLGMIIVNSIVRQIGGTLSAEDQDGAQFTLTAPLR